MLRVVVAVALAVALLGVSQPAIEDARTSAAERAAERELAEIQRAVAHLRTEAAVPYGKPGARRVVVLDLPERSFGSTGVDYVAVGGLPDGGSGGNRLAYKVADHPPNTVRIDADLRVERSRGGVRWLAEDGDPLVLRGGGRHRLAFVLVRYDGRRVVVVRKLG